MSYTMDNAHNAWAFTGLEPFDNQGRDKRKYRSQVRAGTIAGYKQT